MNMIDDHPGYFSRVAIIAKHRNGQVGRVKLSWHPLTTTFGDHPDEAQSSQW